MAKEHNDLEGRKGRAVFAVHQSVGRNRPVEMSEIELLFGQDEGRCEAIVVSAPVDAYAVVTRELANGMTLHSIEPIHALWEDIAPALADAALADRRKENVTRQWEQDNPDKMPWRMTLARGTYRLSPRPLLPPCEPTIDHWVANSYPAAHVVDCPCGRHALVAGPVRGRAPKYCSEACRDKFSRKPAVAAWVKQRSAKRAAERAETPKMTCAHCAAEFTPPRGNARFCSPECRVRHNSLARSLA